MTEQTPRPLAYLAEAVAVRRRALGLTREGLRIAGGPSDSTMARIENPAATTAFPRPSTLDRLDRSLRWRSGSAAGCLELREPLPADATRDPLDEVGDKSPVAERRDPLDFDYVAVPASDIRDGLAAIQAFADKYRDDAGEVAAIVRFAHRLGAAHATEILERFKGAGRELPGFMHTALSPYLVETEPKAISASDQLIDQQYRRWLAGLEGDDEGRFRRRLVGKMRADDPLAT